MEKYNQLVNEITNFRQLEGESLCTTWNRFQELIRKCPHYEGDDDRKVAIFFNGISPETRLVINSAAGGSIRQSTSEQAIDLIKKLARNENESTRANTKNINALMEETRANTKNTNASIRNLENQIGQLAKQFAERAPGTFPSNTVTNPKEDCMAVTTRSGKVVAASEKPSTNVEADEKLKEVKETEKEVIIPDNVEKTFQKGEEEEPPIIAERKKFELNPEYVRAMAPYPERFKKDAQKQQYARFLDIFKKLHECQTVTLTEECSAIIQKKFPPKLNDPGSFNIRIAIGNTEVGRALCDLGASINLMPLSVCKSLGITELKPTMVSLQLADRSLRRPSGIIEDVLVKVD
ncbi:uncharacterized protein LOC133317563, partial [Gastrolobium bilobum]|uniref:uncharacterized protein LOC133317563 n=1 Tax=Gastrolobium bilobum TaxID=150636 RepID=UPI002AB2C708